MHASELASIDAALRVAGERLEAARQVAARVADREAAVALRGKFHQFLEHARRVDAALQVLVSEGQALQTVAREMHQLGQAAPSHEQLDSLGHRCLLTALAQTIWGRRFERIPPLERRSFADLADTWRDHLLPQIEARIGDEREPEAA